MALTVKIKGDATHFEKVMAKVGSSLGGVTKRMAGLTLKTAAFGAALAGIGGGLAVATKFVDSLKDASSKAAGLEELSANFETLTGSATKAADHIANYRKEATKSPLSTNDYAQAGKTLLAFGGNVDDLLPQLRMLGDVSMGNAERFSLLTLAFGQIQAAGRLAGQELNQLIGQGFNPLQVISKKTGISMADLKKKMEEGAITSGMVTQAFREATSSGGLFFRAIDKGASTFNGRIASLMDTVDSLKITFGTGMNEGLKTGLDAASAWLPQFEAKIANLGKAVGTAIASAVDGDFAIFVKTGNVIGQALMEGMQATIGGYFVNSIIRPMAEWLEGGNMGTPEAKANAKNVVNGYLGQRMSASELAAESLSSGPMAEMLQDLRDEIRSSQSGNKAEARRQDLLRKQVELQEKMLQEMQKEKPMFRR